MKFALLDAGEEAEYNGVGSVVMFKMFLDA